MSEKSRLDYMIDDRKSKLEQLRTAGVECYPPTTHRTHSAIDAKNHLDQVVSVAGRLTAIREHGKIAFADLKDETGSIQITWQEKLLKPEDFAQIKLLDPGDFVEATGTVMVTKSGEITVLIDSYRLLAKTLRPIPTAHQDIEHVEERFRKRYLDLLSENGSRERLYARIKIIQAMRDFYNSKGFLEVDTPILQSIPGGTSAKPFETHYNAYDADVSLRIAPELYLKRLLVGGFERVYEFARCFRNEQADTTHNPEFTQIESYAAYWDYEDTMNFVEEMLCEVVQQVFGTNTLTIRGQQVVFARPFARKTFLELSDGHRTDVKFKVGTQGIIQPTFITNHPVELIPLAKRDPADPSLVQSFQLVMVGVELVKAYSELNDPIEQRERFAEQEKLRQGGDEEAQRNDPDFLEALEYGMPPASGMGIGIDRLVTLLTDSDSLRETMLFPFMKPRKE
jgi:lysyl-tRNA synthetase class 2